MPELRPDSELALEKETMDVFSRLGFAIQNCYHETYGKESTLGRETRSEVVLVSRLRPALQKLNPDLSDEALSLVIEELTRSRGTMSIAGANQEIYKLLRNGVKVNIRIEDEETVETVRVIDWNNPENNDFFLASQFWITGEMYTRRADLVGFVNGIPLVFVELKASHRRLEDAYNNNLKDYKDTIPQVFRYNGFIILSNGSEAKLGSISAQFEHFNDWKKINSEGEEGIIFLDTMIRGTCDPQKLLDLIENFVLYQIDKGGLRKLVAKNHQYLGVNNAVDAMRDIRRNQGRLGVFWHTQGSGKSYSMIFFTQKVLRKLSGNYTFVIVTDRIELDKQIYKNFADVGAVIEKDVHAKDGEHLKQLLTEDHRMVFTIIHKFHTERGRKYPKLSDRSDIIVITDEAHRTQYDILALNMRNALPNAAFIGFTGTPLMEGEEKTRTVFGDYVSIYNFRQSVEDGATVPLYYENRIPELQLTNDSLNEDLQNLVEEAELDDAQERKLEREFAREYHLITRDDRLEKVAEDIVSHFMGRGHRGKGMVVCIDKATAVRMYDKVTARWKAHLKSLKQQLRKTSGEQKQYIQNDIDFMGGTDLAVVVSSSQNEIELFRKKGLDIAPHRKRMVEEDLDTKFKDTDDPFRLVFVCAMWMTGFDAPACSTIYLDKPMRNHTLMQTIARANRVFGEKNNGLIVDYIGVFRNLQKALAIYGSGAGGGIKEGDRPIKDKSELVEELRKAITAAADFCRERGIALQAVRDAEGFERIRLRDQAVDAIIATDQSKLKYLALAGNTTRLFKAILPDEKANEFGPDCAIIRNIADKIRSLTPETDISAIQEEIEKVLDSSIAAEGYVIREETPEYGLIDLSRIDFDALRKKFQDSRKHIEVEKLRGAIRRKLGEMVRLNRTRIDYFERFQAMIDEYNTGAQNVEIIFDELVKFAQELNEEEQRGIKENLAEEELAVFDLLTKPDMKLSKKEEKEVKKVAKELLETLKGEKLVLDWRKKQQARAAVKLAIEVVLDKLPKTYSEDKYNEKCEVVFQHVYDSYYGEGKSVYGMVG